MRISDWSSDVCSSDLGVGHFEQAGDAAEHRGAAARFEVFLVLQPRLAEMDLGVDRSGKDSEAGAVDDLACVARYADPGDLAVAHADIGIDKPAGREHAAVLQAEVEGLGHFQFPSRQAISPDRKML